VTIRVLNGFWEWLAWPVLAFLVGLRASEGLARQRILRPSHEPDGVNFLVDRAEESQYRSVGLNRTGPTSAFGGRDNKCKTDTPILESGKEILETIAVVYCHLEFSCFTPLDSFLSVFVFGAEFPPRGRERH
jgi:hypothetical protein